ARVDENSERATPMAVLGGRSWWPLLVAALGRCCGKCYLRAQRALGQRQVWHTEPARARHQTSQQNRLTRREYAFGANEDFDGRHIGIGTGRRFNRSRAWQIPRRRRDVRRSAEIPG